MGLPVWGIVLVVFGSMGVAACGIGAIAAAVRKGRRNQGAAASGHMAAGSGAPYGLPGGNPGEEHEGSAQLLGEGTWKAPSSSSVIAADGRATGGAGNIA